MALCTYVKTPSKIKAFLNAEDGQIMKVQTNVKRVLFRYGFGNITWRAFYETRAVNVVYVQDLCGVPSIG